MDNTSIFDIMIACSGLYLIYGALQMKRTGEIKPGIAVGKDVDIKRIRDKEGFIKYMFGRILLMGILSAALGAGFMLNTYAGGPAYLELIGIVIYLAVLVLFAAASGKARKKYID